MTIARALVRIDSITDDMAARDLAAYEVVEVTGEGPDWEAAKAAVVVPDGAQVLAWIRE